MRREGVRQRGLVRGGSAALAALLCALLLAAGAHAQQPSPTLAVNQVDASAYPKLTALLTVLDANGVPVPGMTAQQFHVFDGTAPLPVGSVQTVQDADLHLSVALVIDTSGSMQGTALARAKQAATDFVNALGPNDDVSLIAFSDAIKRVTPFTSDRAALASAIGALQAGGATSLYSAVQNAVVTAGGAPSPRKAVVFLTDGQNDTTTSQATAKDATTAATSAGVPIFAIGFGDQPDAAFLQSLADATHGAYSPATSADVGQVYGRIATQLRAQYVLTVQAVQPASGNGATLRVSADTPGGPAIASAAFTRGSAAPVAPAVTAVATAGQTRAAGSGSSSGETALIAIAVALALVLAAGVLLLVLRRLRATRRQRAREREAGRQSAEPLPNRPTSLSKELPVAAATGTGRLVEQGANGHGRVFELGAGPAVIGSAHGATVQLAPGDAVAGEHARIWLRDGRYQLHHTGGVRRKTLVGGREADWVTLEPGDELQFGAHVFLFEDGSEEVGGRR